MMPKGTKRSADGQQVQRETSTKLKSVADPSFIPDLRGADARNAQKVLINTTTSNITTEHHHHHHHSFTTVTTAAATAAHVGHETSSPWPRLVKALRHVESSLASGVNSYEAAFNEAVKSKLSFDEAQDAAAAAVAAQQSELNARRTEKDKLRLVVEEARNKVAELSAATEEQTACESALAVFAIIKDDMTVFKNGSFEKPDDPKHVAALMPHLQRIRITDELLQALPGAVGKLASARSDRERQVIQDIEKAVMAHKAAASSTLALSPTIVREREAALHAVLQEETVASVSLTTAEVELHTLTVALQKAQHASEKAAVEVESARTDRDVADGFLARFRAGPLVAFSSLDENLACRIIARSGAEVETPGMHESDLTSRIPDQKILPITFQVP